jgi:hypothetical protein
LCASLTLRSSYTSSRTSRAAATSGRERGVRIAGIAREIDDPGVEALLRRKYGWQKRVLDRLNGSPARGAWTTIEIAAS